MANSLRDALLKSGISRPTVVAPKKPRGEFPKANGKRPLREANGGQDVDLAKAYALRARSEAQEREQARREAECKKREKQERHRKLRELLDGKSLNRDDTDKLRHYEFHGKIRRVHVTGEQLAALNAGDLAVLQSGGRFILVDAGIARKAAAIEPGCVALLVDPDQGEGADDDGVPDDLIW